MSVSVGDPSAWVVLPVLVAHRERSPTQLGSGESWCQIDKHLATTQDRPAARSYFFASGFQFRMTVMGEAASSVMVFIRNR